MAACKRGGATAPVSNAVVEVWHCDAGGIYSGFESASTGGTSSGSYSVGNAEAEPGDDGHLPARCPADRA